ncbi:ribosome biogenesis GTPase YlqF [Mechercharimyces sp. CAU 1602]|uniref:ribosome biogenesis GTPase YlqF n=1 Tax=Mechercharimyces sp. CAU 1602 TaxID=2973933 RepID=UPI002161EF3A|nr:ribosome biogenesis GTPase YlqF [Mechercharimyces sp. CAU 1602]MCS1351351.1 ribosome biogenesis GTPase YlqF [Mechercharimyces sp. CAU 1602]
MTIQWYPGHMAKARREVTEKVKLVDVLIELLDARLPLSSRNPFIEELAHKPRIIVLTKSDMADAKATADWIEFFQSTQTKVIALDTRSGKGIQKIQTLARDLLADKIAQNESKGIQARRIRAMILGIPNVGKSSLINRLAGKSAAKTGDRPGVTKAQQWIRVGQEMELLDTPGILWPKFDDPKVGLRLASSGAIREDILPADDIALYLLEWLSRRYPELLSQRYQVEETDQTPLALLEEVGRRRGCMRRGGEIDYEKAASIVLSDVRSGRIGLISLEWPRDWEEVMEDA